MVNRSLVMMKHFSIRTHLSTKEGTNQENSTSKQNALLKESTKMLNEYFNRINKVFFLNLVLPLELIESFFVKQIQFTTLETKIEKKFIGELKQPTLPSRSIKQNAHLIVTGSSGKLESIVLVKSQNKLIISDKNGGSLKIIDLDSYSIDLFKNENIKKPSAMCIGKNDELFVSDHSKFDKILVFDTSNKSYLRQFKIKPMFVSNMKIDLLDEQNLLYLSDTGDDKIVVRFSETHKFKTIINITRPNFMEFSEEFMYVSSQPNFNLNKRARRLEGLQKGSNCIFILNKKTYEIVKRVAFENWLVPFGLKLDENFNIYTTASELSETRIVSENPFLYIINSNGELVEKIEIEVSLKRPCSISFFKDYFFICDDSILSMFEINLA
jgi:hypothetical protein